MKLLHVVSSMDPALGGVSQAIRTIIKGLAAAGVDNEVASSDAPDMHWNQAAPFVTHTLGPSRGAWQYSAQFLPWLLENLGRFDGVILHGLWLYHGYALHQALRRFSRRPPRAGRDKGPCPRFFVMPHGMLDPYFQRAPGRRLKAWRNRAYWHFIEAAVINSAYAILFTCETERLLARETFAPYWPKRELVVGLGVEEPPPCTSTMHEAFLAKCSGLQDRPYLLFLSRIHEKKGVDLLLQAYAHLARAVTPTKTSTEQGLLSVYPEFPALVIAGPGLETAYGQHMHQLAAELPELAATGVFFPGMLTGDAKWGAFYGCEAFVLPSHQENFGIAIVEALACSKPALISNQVNIWPEIEATDSGIIADDTLAGTQHLLESWCGLTKSEKWSKKEQARVAYLSYFAIETAAEKIAAALR